MTKSAKKVRGCFHPDTPGNPKLWQEAKESCRQRPPIRNIHDPQIQQNDEKTKQIASRKQEGHLMQARLLGTKLDWTLQSQVLSLWSHGRENSYLEVPNPNFDAIFIGSAKIAHKKIMHQVYFSLVSSQPAHMIQVYIRGSVLECMLVDKWDRPDMIFKMRTFFFPQEAGFWRAQRKLTDTEESLFGSAQG